MHFDLTYIPPLFKREALNLTPQPCSVGDTLVRSVFHAIDNRYSLNIQLIK